MSRAERILDRRWAAHRHRCRQQVEDPKAHLRPAFAEAYGGRVAKVQTPVVLTMPGWVLNSSSVTITLTDQVWGNWQQAIPEQVEEIRRQQVEYYRAQEVARQEALLWHREAVEQQRLAAARARALLTSLLDAEQKAEMADRGRFHVRSNRGRRFCIVASGQAGNVYWVDENSRTLGRFCCHPAGVPDPDAWIAQMLQLTHDEDGFFAVANLTEGRRPSDHADGLALAA